MVLLLMARMIKPLSIVVNAGRVAAQHPHQRAVARVLRLARRRCARRRDRAITAETDLRLCRFFGLSDGWWLALQARHDIEVAREAMADELQRIRRFEPQPA
ncbi:MAG TPA: addiction module antidote protein, HigA family [Albitalea sp.]